MIIPEKVINFLLESHKDHFYNLLAPIVMYIRGEHFDTEALSGDALTAYNDAIKILEPILRRREQARKRRKELKEKQQSQPKPGSPAKGKKAGEEVDKYLINPEILDEIYDFCINCVPLDTYSYQSVAERNDSLEYLRRIVLKHYGKYFSDITYDPYCSSFRLFW